MADRNDWEMSKENIQPLEHGRKPNVLKVALAANPEDVILLQQKTFETELRTYTGEDPLSIWCKYINWVEQNFPKGGKEGHGEQLIKKCLTIFKNDKKYYEDNRFIQIWLKYAKMTPNSNDVYNYMYSNKIGLKNADFYIAWSWDYEERGNMKKADQVLREGERRCAEPMDKLKAYSSELELRIALKIKTDAGQDLEAHRSAFTLLKPINKKNSAPVVRSASVSEPNVTSMMIGRQQPKPKSNSITGKVPFKIYNSENIVPTLPKESVNEAPYILSTDLSKENDMKPSKWNKVKVKQHKSIYRPASSDPGFKLHCDESLEPDLTPRSFPKVFNVLQTRKESNSPPPLALFEPPDPMKKPMYDKDKVYCGAEEFSLEEIRAAAWLKRKRDLESEKLIREQQRILAEKENQIKTLMQQIEILKSSKNLDENSLNNLNCNKNISHEQAELSCDAKAESNSFHSSKKSFNRELFPETNVTSTYKDASYMVREIYNSTLPHSANMVNKDMCSQAMFTDLECANLKSSFPANYTVSESENDACLNPNVASHVKPLSDLKDPLIFYHDPTEKLQALEIKDTAANVLKKDNLEIICKENADCGSYVKNIPRIVLSEFTNKENEENIPPEDYVLDTSKREIIGILQPSKDIECVPLDQQDGDCEISDSEDEFLHGSQPVQNDITLCPPCNTEQFMSADFQSSTPHSKSVKRLYKNQMIYPQEPKVEVQEDIVSPSAASCLTDITSAKLGVRSSKDQSTFRGVPIQLSVIMETSKEVYKSCSSSGSSAGSTKLSQIDLCLTQEKSNAQKFLLSKSDAYKRLNISLGLSHLTDKCSNLNLHNETDAFATYCSDVDPFDQNLNSERLSSMNLSSLFANLQEIKKNTRQLKLEDSLQFGNFSCTLGKLVNEGAFGRVFEADCCNVKSDTPQSKVAIKVCKHSNEWEFYVCSILQERLKEVTDLPSVSMSIMDILFGQKFMDGIVLVSEFSKHGTVLNLINKYRLQSKNLPEIIIMYMAWELLHIVFKIHQCKIIHSDIKPDNILIRNDFQKDKSLLMFEKSCLLQIIDFGVSIDLTFFKPGVCFKSIRKDGCCEMYDNKPWVYQLDWHGVLNCIHVLLFFDYMKVKKNDAGRWQIEKKFRRYWDTNLWSSLFDELLNIPHCYQQPDIFKYTKLIENKLKQQSVPFLKHMNDLL